MLLSFEQFGHLLFLDCLNHRLMQPCDTPSKPHRAQLWSPHTACVGLPGWIGLTSWKVWPQPVRATQAEGSDPGESHFAEWHQHSSLALTVIFQLEQASAINQPYAPRRAGAVNVGTCQSS